MQKVQLGIVGCGNMAEAILANVLKRGLLPPQAIIAHDCLSEKQAAFQNKFGITVAKSTEDLAGQSHSLLIAVKPQDAKALLTALGPLFVQERKLLISIVAGLAIDQISEWLGGQTAIARVMPNTPIQVGQGMSVYTCKNCNEEEQNFVEAVFKAGGQCIHLADEHHFDAVTAVSGSGPAYLFLFIETLQAAARTLGLPDSLVGPLVLQTVAGSLALLEASPQGPKELREKVSSKGGTTEAAMAILEPQFGKLLETALQAAKARSAALGKTR